MYTWFIATIRIFNKSLVHFPSIRYISKAHLFCGFFHIGVSSWKNSAYIWDRNVLSSARFSLAFESDSAPEDAAGKRVPLEEEQYEHREYAGGEGEFAQREVAVVARAEIHVI